MPHRTQSQRPLSGAVFPCDSDSAAPDEIPEVRFLVAGPTPKSGDMCARRTSSTCQRGMRVLRLSAWGLWAVSLRSGLTRSGGSARLPSPSTTRIRRLVWALQPFGAVSSAANRKSSADARRIGCMLARRPAASKGVATTSASSFGSFRRATDATLVGHEVLILPSIGWDRRQQTSALTLRQRDLVRIT